MKATLTLSNRGVVTLPAKLRRALGLRPDDQLIAETTPEGLLLRPAVTLPIEIYSEKRIREFDEAEADLTKVLNRRSRAKKTAKIELATEVITASRGAKSEGRDKVLDRSEAPTGIEALELWDAVEKLATMSGMAELKRSNRLAPDFT